MPLKALTNSIKMDLPTANAIFYGSAALFAGRKFCVAGAYKIGGKFAELMGRQDIATEWNKAGDESLKKAKKGIFRDLTVFAGLIAVWNLTENPEERIKIEEEANKSWINWIKENPGTTVSLMLNALFAVESFFMHSIPFSIIKEKNDLHWYQGKQNLVIYTLGKCIDVY